MQKQQDFVLYVIIYHKLYLQYKVDVLDLNLNKLI